MPTIQTHVAKLKLPNLSTIKYGLEYAINALRDQNIKTSADAVFLLDAKKALGLLNRKLTSKNIKNTCTSLLTVNKNSYSNLSKSLFTKKLSTLKKGQPSLAKALYGLAIVTLIKNLSVGNVSLKRYSTDGMAVGKINNLRTILDNTVSLSEFFSYHVKASKCQLIVKDENSVKQIKLSKRQESH